MLNVVLLGVFVLNLVSLDDRLVECCSRGYSLCSMLFFWLVVLNLVPFGYYLVESCYRG